MSTIFFYRLQTGFRLVYQQQINGKDFKKEKSLNFCTLALLAGHSMAISHFSHKCAQS